MFSTLNLANVNYLVWKDIYNVSDFFEGNAELDLLVDIDQKDKFEEIIFNNDFISLRVNSLLEKKGIKHYIKYVNGKYFHLHVYYKLITGNHFVKEYVFPLEKSLFSNYTLHNNIKVASKELEIAFLITRLIIKKSVLFQNMKVKELDRLAILSKACDTKSVLNFIEKFSPKTKASFQELLSLALDEKGISKNDNSILKEFSNYKTLKGILYAFEYLKIHLVLMYLRVNKISNKTIKNKGIDFAILGSDGSGKTTISNRLFKQYRAKTSCKFFYLGGNFKTYSIITRLCYLNYYFMRFFSPFKDKYYLAWLFYYNSFAMLELGKANDRKRKIVRGNKLKAKGWVVIYERFPIVNLFDFPNKLMELKNHHWFLNSSSKIIRTLIHKIEQIVENIERPDASFLIITDLEKMKQRRVLAHNELIDIDRKLKSQKQYLTKNKANLIVIENNGELVSVINSINQEINSKICISSL
tara:strand:+ start:2439 stop:3848 length:1410 start_codon:yes stop_codon:yes gene_type:complete